MTTRPRTKKSKSDVAQLRGPLNGLIAQRMRQLGITTIKEFADTFDIGRSTVYDLVRGRSDGTFSNPSLDTISKLAEALHRPAHEILYLVSPNARGADTAPVMPVSRLPVLLAGCVGAGPDQSTELDRVVYVENEMAAGRDLIAFHVKGHSMAGGRRPIYDGDLVIVDRNLAPEPNYPAVVRLVGDGYVVKRYRASGRLDSTNPDYDGPHAIITPEEVEEMVGGVVRVQADVI